MSMKPALLIAVLLLVGCANMPTVEAYAGHMSQPFAGPHPPPIGDNGKTPETSANMLGSVARWQHGRAFVETSVDYDLSHRLAGGPWLCGARFGFVILGGGT